jgi:hypothetical protein
MCAFRDGLHGPSLERSGTVALFRGGDPGRLGAAGAHCRAADLLMVNAGGLFAAQSTPEQDMLRQELSSGASAVTVTGLQVQEKVDRAVERKIRTCVT